MNKAIFSKLFKILAMLPIFLFIGIGIFVSLDIIQPSMFRVMEQHAAIFAIASLVGAAPIFLITMALQNLLKIGNKTAIAVAIFLTVVFMCSEVIYSYISVAGFFMGQVVPISKIIGIIFLPFTFSLFYFSNLFAEFFVLKKTSKPASDKSHKAREEIIGALKELGSGYKSGE
jgi:hypothetical protein